MRVVPGALVDFFSEGAIVAGVVLADEKGRLRVMTESGREDRIAPGRVLAAYEGSAKAAPSPGKPLDAARLEAAHQFALAHARGAASKRREIDLGLVWELLVDQGGEKMLGDLAELAMGERTPRAVAAMLRELLEEKVRFSRRGDLWEPRPRSAVEDTLRQRERERRRAEERIRFVAAARAAMLHGAAFVRTMDEEEMRSLHLLEDLAIHGSGGAASRDALAILAELPASGENPEESAFRVLRALGMFAEDENLFIRRFGLRTELPADAEALAAQAVEGALHSPGHTSDLPPSSIPPGLAREIVSGVRRDLTHLEMVSIDDAMTSEIDDALSIEPVGGGRFRAGVHIADPGFFVLPGTELDRIAESRAVTFYLPERRLLMLPPGIAEDAAALLPGLARPALSFFATLDEAGTILETEVAASVVRSQGRVTYDEADGLVRAAREEANREGESQRDEGRREKAGAAGGTEARPDANLPSDRYDGGATGEGLPEFAASTLPALHTLAVALEAGRVSSGAHVIRSPEVDLSVAPEGTITIKRLEGDGPGRLLVSEMMILAGRIAAQFCLARSIPCIFRRQAPPEEAFPSVLGGPYDPVAVRKARRGLRRGETGLVPGRHFALGIDAYAQATSPIRRFQDLAIHRQIKSFLASGAPVYDAEALQRIAATTDEAERVGRLAERGSDEYWTLKYLAAKTGQEVEGVVVAREPRRVEVELSETLYTVSIPPRPDHVLGQRLRFTIEGVNPRAPAIRLRQLD